MKFFNKTNNTTLDADQYKTEIYTDANTNTISSDISPTLSHDIEIHTAFDRRAERRLWRKIDLRLIPILGALYTICGIDRSNIAVARISGLDQDLGLKIGNRASIVLVVFFAGYIATEIPSNIIVKKVGPANWLGFIVFAWGCICIGTGFLHDWISFTVLRVLLGAFEGCFFPGCVYIVSSWYVRHDVQKRLAGFYLLSQALSSLGSILAYGLIQISPNPNFKGWRWIYIVEGAITCVLGIVGWFTLINFPDSKRNKFLTRDETRFVLMRLKEDRGRTEEEKVTWRVIGTTMLDWQIWSYAFMYMTAAIVSYAFVLFLPIILRNELGLSQQLSFLLVAPPAVFSAIAAMIVSWMADKFRMRGVFVLIQALISVVGLCMIGFLNSPWPRYVGAFLGEWGGNGLVVTILAWQSNNVTGDAKRSVSSAIIVMASGVSGIYSSLTFRQQDAPAYIPGIVACIVPLVVTFFLAMITMVVLSRKNKKADEGKDLVDGLSDFRYTI